MLDRIDIFIEVPRVEYEKLSDDRPGESSDTVRSRIERARQIQRDRFDGTKLFTNSDMTPAEVRLLCNIEPTAKVLLGTAMRQLSLSARAFHRILKLSRTIADLAGTELIESSHLAEALQYRPRDIV